VAIVPPEVRTALVAFESRSITLSPPNPFTPDDEDEEVRAENRWRAA
jgi:hypothetical protein